MKKDIKSICMLSTHGYVDPKPILGKTDTGGQVTYVLELSKALAKKGIKADLNELGKTIACVYFSCRNV